ncbi:MAG: diguanylate cyclase [Gammaproteobacteria bacterium]|nr:MAG: diguanylate cyclase [Gammaproteobacteria bacterium]
MNARKRKSDEIISPIFLKEDTSISEAKSRGLELVSEISDTILRERNFFVVIGQATKLILDLTKLTSIAIYGYDNISERLDLITHDGDSPEKDKVALKLLLSESFASIAASEKRVINTFEMGSDELLDKQISKAMTKEGENCIVSVPMIAQEELTGVLNFTFSPARKLMEVEEHILLSIAKNIGLALSNAKYVSMIEHEIKRRERAEIKLKEINELLEEEVQKQTLALNKANENLKKANEQLRNEIQQKHYESITDGLSGLYSSPYFNVRINAEIAHASRYGHDLSMLFIDINDFKKINERLGYNQANDVISDIGTLIKDSIRNVDSGYRYTGKQFVVLLPETNTENSTNLVDRIIEKMRSRELPTSKKFGIPISISVGIAAMEKGINPDDFVDRAKNAALLSKESGENEYRVWSADLP